MSDRKIRFTVDEEVHEALRARLQRDGITLADAGRGLIQFYLDHPDLTFRRVVAVRRPVRRRPQTY
jgi:hypothetical protein